MSMRRCVACSGPNARLRSDICVRCRDKAQNARANAKRAGEWRRAYDRARYHHRKHGTPMPQTTTADPVESQLVAWEQARKAHADARRWRSDR